MTREIVIATRGSQLALRQANLVAEEISKMGSGKVSLKTIKTTGDKILNSPLAKIGDKGLFVKEIENALLAKGADLAVHSMKDIPTEVPQGLVIVAVLEREDPRDALVSRQSTSLKELPANAVIGTSSLRRRAQLLNLRSDFRFVDLRGNIDTRIRKMHEQSLDAIILSGVGLTRLGLADKITERIHPKIILPAVGQGVIAVETRRDDREMLELMASLNHLPTWQAITAERALLKSLEGGCQIPIGALASVDSDKLVLEAVVASLDGSKLVRDSIAGAASDAEELGARLAQKLLRLGADKILREIRKMDQEEN